MAQTIFAVACILLWSVFFTLAIMFLIRR